MEFTTNRRTAERSIFFSTRQIAVPGGHWPLLTAVSARLGQFGFRVWEPERHLRGTFDIPPGRRIICYALAIAGVRQWDSDAPVEPQAERPLLRNGLGERCGNCLCGEATMDFYDVLDQVLDLLRQRGRVTYNALKRQFGLDEACLQDLKDEIIEAQRVAVDENDRVLVWTGDGAVTPPPAAAAVKERQPDAAPRAYTPSHLTDKILAARPALEGERKQVTVLFADIKDSTELIKDLDPEAAQQLLDPALHHMMDAVHRYEGTVNQVLGDGIMALFGAPIAHEDHALRACYAALAMQAAMRAQTDAVRRTRGLELCMRVGLNSGEVVVRAIGSDLHMDYSAVGETTHLAARMEQLATPGSSRLTAAT